MDKKTIIGINNYQGVLEMMLARLTERHREIIKMRYGIGAKKAQTLDEIGKKYGVTRERVRQIISESFRKLRKQDFHPSLQEVRENIDFTINKKSGIIEKSEIELLPEKADEQEKKSLRFFLDFFEDFALYEIKDEMKRSYGNRGFDLENWKRIKNHAKETLAETRHPMTGQDLFRETFKRKIGVDEKIFFDFLEVSTEIKKNNFGKWGLKNWEEITPKGTREKIYLILKETGHPLHFTKIAELMDIHKLNKRKTHAQTVHNELIKDKRFVLVGRGTYALSEWGYKQGTVRELVEDILKKNVAPMRRDEILKKILDMRQVKKSTVVINLNNFFERVGKDRYAVKSKS